ncbi:alpha/beta fold hydrolase [Wenzhouxiangella sp. XN79A]|uniref:alpha/beta fold hydrolase n=1 Tax=Wenzhouxiangella sp. XN79A TaxID=2724193 RepID=UPI00144ADCCF|nr:alpha/beta fold hydrolase [Wenzhouxiangella sp. XN79A]NKI34747.1 alpha/beta fold hydrolase [Wenzhouxiangella sp. XN79A]
MTVAGRSKRRRILLAVATALALVSIAFALARLWQAQAGVEAERSWLGPTPVTVYRPAAESGAAPTEAPTAPTADGLPVVLISHGFAGSQQLMEAFAYSLARNGYLAVTFDYYGHGRNLEPLAGDVMDVEGATRTLVDQTAAVAEYARSLPGAGQRFAILGHSMASDIIVRYADADPGVDAAVAISLFSPAVTESSPENFLVIVGALEGRLKDEALRVVGLVADDPEPGVTYGEFDDGSARRAVFAPGVEHVGVLYSPTSLEETVSWLDHSFGRAPGPYDDANDGRGSAILMLFAGLVLLAWPLSRLLPQVVEPARGLNPRWRELLPAAFVPAFATPLLLFAFPADFLGVLVGGYLAVHFGLYGLITAGFCIGLRRRRATPVVATRSRRVGAAVVAAIAATLYAAGVFGLAMDRFVTSFAVTEPRVPLLALMLGGTLIYFLADEWLTRGPDVPRGAHLLTRFCFLLSLGLAVALSFEDLFFLLIIAVVIIPYFLIYGLIGGWVYRRTGDPLVSALPSAVAFGWTLAVVFPQMSG